MLGVGGVVGEHFEEEAFRDGVYVEVVREDLAQCCARSEECVDVVVGWIFVVIKF